MLIEQYHTISELLKNIIVLVKTWM